MSLVAIRVTYSRRRDQLISHLPPYGVDRIAGQIRRAFFSRRVQRRSHKYGDIRSGEGLQFRRKVEQSLGQSTDARLQEVGLPCIIKPAFGGGWKSVYKIYSKEDAIRAYEESGSLTMTLQEFIPWQDYIRCLSVGKDRVRAIRYIPRPMGQGEYVQDQSVLDPHDKEIAEEYTKRFNTAIGYDMNALEFAVKDHVLYAIDITNYVCDFD